MPPMAPLSSYKSSVNLIVNANLKFKVLFDQV